jgi:hypothetical protein
MDFLVVPTIGFRLLYALVVLRHDRRHIISIRVTDHPTAQWIARQIADALPWDEVPRYLIRDRDAAYGHAVRRKSQAMGIRDRPTAPRSPWQNTYAERLVGSIRRECLDHIIVLSEAHLRHILKAYASYYNNARTTFIAEERRSPPPLHRADRAYHFDTDPRWPAPSVLPDIVSDRDSLTKFCACRVCSYQGRWPPVRTGFTQSRPSSYRPEVVTVYKHSDGHPGGAVYWITRALECAWPLPRRVRRGLRRCDVSIRSADHGHRRSGALLTSSAGSQVDQ